MLPGSFAVWQSQNNLGRSSEAGKASLFGKQNVN
jgi:hypothetical protein